MRCPNCHSSADIYKSFLNEGWICDNCGHKWKDNDVIKQLEAENAALRAAGEGLAKDIENISRYHMAEMEDTADYIGVLKDAVIHKNNWREVAGE